MHRNRNFWHAGKVVAFPSELRQRLEVQQLKNSSADASSSSLRSEILLTIILVLARRSEKLTATLRFRSSCPLRSHTDVYLAIILNKIRCVNRFCNRKCSLVASFHSTQIFFRLVSSSVPQKFCGLPQNFCSTRETGAPENFVKLRRYTQ